MKRCIIAICCTVCAIGILWYRSPMRENSAVVSVKAATVTAQDIFDSVIAPGVIQENVVREIVLPVSATVKKLNVSLGDTVASGQFLFEIQPNSTAESVPALSEILNQFGITEDEAVSALGQYKVDAEKLFPSTPSVALGETQIKSPIHGIVTAINIKENQPCTGNSVAMRISNYDDLSVSAEIPELYIGSIRVGQSVSISGEALGSRNYSGIIKQISPVAKQKSSLTGSGETYVPVTISIQNEDRSLRPGYTVTTQIFTTKKKNAPTIPYHCILQDEAGRELVFIISEGRVYKKRILTGLELEDEVEVCYGLEIGDQIVENPPDSLRNGTKIALK